MKKLPSSRNSDIIVTKLDNEVLIYDLTTHKAFNLNETSSIVYQSCGDGLTFEELKRKHRFTDDLIYLTLDELKEKNLLEKDAGYKSSLLGLSRREAIRKVGLATMVVLPVITGLVAPLAVHAVSNSCAATNCKNGNTACNPGGGCSALRADFVCCSALGSCSCASANVCASNGGVTC
jgi:hypothetical protein